MEEAVGKLLRVYRTVKTANRLLDNKRKLKDALDTHGERMGTAMDLTEAGRKVATGDIDRYDFRVACKATVRHGPKIYGYVAQRIRERKEREGQSDDT